MKALIGLIVGLIAIAFTVAMTAGLIWLIAYVVGSGLNAGGL